MFKQLIKSELLNEGFFKDMIKKSFKKNDETIQEKAQQIDDIFDKLKKEGVFPSDESVVTSKKGEQYLASSPQGKMIISVGDYRKITKLLEDILMSEKSDELNFELFKRNLKNVLLKKGDRTKNTVKYLQKVYDSLQSRSGYEKGLPTEEFYEPEEEETSQVPKSQYLKEKMALQIQLLKMQEWLKKENKSVIIVFEGRDTAGKGSTIKKFTEFLNPRFYKVVTKGVPTPEERKDWFGRYAGDIEPGKIIFFDRSWYNRGIVEPVMGYSSQEEYDQFMKNVNEFEASLVDQGNYLIKFWLSITKETQARRFKRRQTSPLLYWKFSPNDEQAQEKWDSYTYYKDKVLDVTSTSKAPWIVVDSNDKRISGLNAMRYVLNEIPYEGKDEAAIGKPYPEAVTTLGESEEFNPEDFGWAEDIIKNPLLISGNVTKSNCMTGIPVVRGPNWTYGNQDRNSIYGIIINEKSYQLVGQKIPKKYFNPKKCVVNSEDDSSWVNVVWLDGNDVVLNANDYTISRPDLKYFKTELKETTTFNPTILIL